MLNAVGDEVESTGNCGNSSLGHTLPVSKRGLGGGARGREGFLEVTISALRSEGERLAAKPGLEGSGYGRLALEGCPAVCTRDFIAKEEEVGLRASGLYSCQRLGLNSATLPSQGCSWHRPCWALEVGWVRQPRRQAITPSGLGKVLWLLPIVD